MIRAFWLGLRLSLGPGRSGRLRVLLMASGSALAAFVVLSSMGLAGVAERQLARERSAYPLFDPDAAALRGEVISDGWNGRELRRVVLAAAREDAPRPPGVKRLPLPGEVLLSPALQRLIRHEPMVAQRFPQQQGPTITEDGLVEPDQLLAYVGVRPTDLPALATGIATFGDPGAGSKLDPRAAQTIGLLVALTLVAPVVMFMAACARLSATARTQRLAALRLLGLSPRRTGVVNAAETGAVALAGSVAGLAASAAMRYADLPVSIGAFSWYSRDLRLSGARSAATIAVLVVISVVVATVGSAPSVAHPLRTRRERSARSVSPWRASVVLIGLAMLWISRATTHGGSTSFIRWMPTFGIGLALTSIGLVIVMPFASLAIGQLLGRSNRPALVLASGRLRHEPAAAGRITAALAVALFAAGVAQVVAADLGARQAEATHGKPPPVINLQASGPPASAARYAELSDLHTAMATARIGPVDHFYDAVVATCAQLRTASAAPLTDCRDGNVYTVGAPPDATDNAMNDALRDVGLPSPAGQLSFTLAFVDGSFAPALVVPPTLWPWVSSEFFVSFAGERYDPQLVTAALAQRFPGAWWNPLITQIDRLDTPRIYRGIIAVGTVAALLIGLAALVVATTDGALERRRPLAHLLAVGASARTIRTAYVAQLLPVTLIMLSLSGAAAIIGGLAYLRWGDPTAGFPLAALARLIGIGILASLLSTGAAMATTGVRTRGELLRQE